MQNVQNSGGELSSVNLNSIQSELNRIIAGEENNAQLREIIQTIDLGNEPIRGLNIDTNALKSFLSVLRMKALSKSIINTIESVLTGDSNSIIQQLDSLSELVE